MQQYSPLQPHAYGEILKATGFLSKLDPFLWSFPFFVAGVQAPSPRRVLKNQVFMDQAYLGRQLGTTPIEFLGGYGVREIEGLRVGYLSGRMGSKYNPTHSSRFPPDGPQRTAMLQWSA